MTKTNKQSKTEPNKLVLVRFLRLQINKGRFYQDTPVTEQLGTSNHFRTIRATKLQERLALNIWRCSLINRTDQSLYNSPQCTVRLTVTKVIIVWAEIRKHNVKCMQPT